MYEITLREYIDIEPKQLLRIWFKPECLLREAKKIKRLKIIKRDKNIIFSFWEVEVDNVCFNWRQIDELDIQRGIVNFKMYGGEFKDYKGIWYILPTNNNKTLLYLTVTIDWGIPVLEPYVKKVLERKTRLLFRGFLKSIKVVAENYGKESRYCYTSY
ncbi:MAG: hypothetical protein NC820_08070 [Candidatus Omnitrophica bacterium]|nr:hypothetical protein [Candidatus Omnitrophota bacterium]